VQTDWWINRAIVQGIPQQCELVLNGNNVRMVRLGRRPRQKQQKKKFGEEGKGKDEDVDGRYKDKNNGGGGGRVEILQKNGKNEVTPALSRVMFRNNRCTNLYCSVYFGYE